MKHELISNIRFKGQKGSLEVSKVSDGRGDPYAFTLVLFYPEGKDIRDLINGNDEGIEKIGEFPPVGIEVVAKSLRMTTQYNSHNGD